MKKFFSPPFTLSLVLISCFSLVSCDNDPCTYYNTFNNKREKLPCEGRSDWEYLTIWINANAQKNGFTYDEVNGTYLIKFAEHQFTNPIDTQYFTTNDFSFEADPNATKWRCYQPDTLGNQISPYSFIIKNKYTQQELKIDSIAFIAEPKDKQCCSDKPIILYKSAYVNGQKLNADTKIWLSKF